MINLNEFKNGDLVQLKNWGSNIPNPFGFRANNLFQIAKIWADQVRLSWQRHIYDVDELDPIPINGVDDQHIHLVCKDEQPCVIMDGMNLGEACTKNGYYLDELRNLGLSKLLELVKQQKVKYVHQVQRYLEDNGWTNYELTIDG